MAAALITSCILCSSVWLCRMRDTMCLPAVIHDMPAFFLHVSQQHAVLKVTGEHIYTCNGDDQHCSGCYEDNWDSYSWLGQVLSWTSSQDGWK